MQHFTWSNKRRRGSMQTGRRIKYQEQSSACVHCLDRSMLSQYPPRPRLTRLDSKHRSSISSASSTSTSTSMASTPSMMAQPAVSTPKSGPCLPLIEETLHLQDLELMMNWCTTAYKSMARGSNSARIWQTTIPNLSLRHPALRQGLLALSALHLASTSTSSRRWQYLDTARSHQAQAFLNLHPDDDASDLPDSECNAIFALCCLMIVFTFGYCLVDCENNTDQPEILDEFFEVFRLTRWLISIMNPLLGRVEAGELGPLVKPEDSHPTMPDMSRLVVLSLRRQNGMEALRDPAHEETLYESAIEHLSVSLEKLMKGGEPKVFAFCWIFRVPAGFLELLEARQPFALVVLAHYAVNLHHLRDCWWMGDWGTRILSEIGDSLEPEWRALIGWPVDATGCFIPQ